MPVTAGRADGVGCGTTFELVADGRPGLRFPLTEGVVAIGRAPDADIRLDAPQVSRRHALVRHHADDVEVEDLGSQNGTFVNGVAVRGRARLLPGDRLQLGSVTLRLERLADSGTAAGDARTVSFSVGNQSAGQIYNVGGNVHQSTNVIEEDPWDELFHGTGAGRLLMAVGLVAVIVGFGLWIAFIFSGFSPPPGADPFTFDPFADARRILGVPQPVLGFVLFAGGGLMAAIGSGLSRAARRRRGEAVGPIRHSTGSHGRRGRR